MRWHAVLACTFLITSCKTLGPQSSQVLEQKQVDCNAPVPLGPYLKPSLQCVEASFWGKNGKPDPAAQAEAKKRWLYPWIPCNEVEWIDGSVDLFGPGPQNAEESIEASTFARIHRDWLGGADRFSPTFAAQALTQGDSFNGNQGNPILETAFARSISDLIRSAKHNILMDIFLFGGTWGTAIAQDLVSAADRGVQVVLIHDNVSKFTVANEMDPLWQELRKISLKHPRLTILDANIRPPARVSSIPFGLERVGNLADTFANFSVAADGRSDHSKVLIVDALFPKDMSDYQFLNPKAMISSRNLVDSAASFYHDEAVIVKGPAAVVSLMAFQSDLYWAHQQAKGQTILLNAEDESLIQEYLRKMDTLRKTPPAIKPQGWVAVQPTEVSANDEVRNLDASIIGQVMAARESIDLYGRIAYNWPLAIALKEAMARGVQVRMILDQQNTGSALLNAAFPYMIAKAPLQNSSQQATLSVEENLPVRWFLPFRPGYTFNSPQRTDLAQEIHSKTMIIDGRYALFGSANMDSFSWAGGFREYSVWVDDPALAAQSAVLFDRLWSHPFLTVSHKTWLGKEPPAPELIRYLEGKVVERQCDRKLEICDYNKIVRGGADYNRMAPLRETVRKITEEETNRIRAIFPQQLQMDGERRVQCRAQL